MSKINKKFIWYTVVMIILSVFLAVARTVILLESLGDDPTFTVHSEFFYSIDKVWKYVFAAVMVFGVLSFLFFRKKTEEFVRKDEVSGCEKIAYFLCAAGFLICFLILFAKQAYSYLYLRGSSAIGLWTFVDSALLLPSGLYFLFRGLNVPSEKNTVLSFFPAVWSVMTLMLSYFSKDYSLVNPTRILANLALAFASLFFLSEIRQYTDYPPSPLYLTVLFPAFTVTVSYGIPQAVSAFLWIGAAPSFPFIAELVILPVSFLIFIRLFSLISFKNNEEITEAL